MSLPAPYYQSADGRITLYCADNADVLPHLSPASFDLVFTSPPYNMGDSPGGGTEHRRSSLPSRSGKGWRFREGYGRHSDAMDQEAYEVWQRRVLEECWRLVDDDGAVFYNHKPRIRHKELWTPLDLCAGLPLRQIVIWHSHGGVNVSRHHFLGEHEWLLVFAKPAWKLASHRASAVGDVWQIRYAAEDYGHPAPFPVALPKRALLTTSARRVLDPFAGVGSTLRAAMDLGRCAVGIEIDERWCRVAVDRLQQQALPLDVEGVTRP